MNGGVSGTLISVKQKKLGRAEITLVAPRPGQPPQKPQSTKTCRRLGRQFTDLTDPVRFRFQLYQQLASIFEIL